MRQPDPRQTPGKRVVLWDHKTGAPPPALTRGAAAFLPLDQFVTLRQQTQNARDALEMFPWAMVIASGGWVPVFLSLAGRNLQLCLRSAVLNAPGREVRRGTERLALPLEPLAFPSVIVNAAPAHVANMVAAWGSRVLSHNNPSTGLLRAIAMLDAPAH